MLKGGFVVGAQHGDGVATCKMADGRWSPPAPFQLSGATFGAQIGGEEQGYVMMVMNDQGCRRWSRATLKWARASMPQRVRWGGRLRVA